MAYMQQLIDILYGMNNCTMFVLNYFEFKAGVPSQSFSNFLLVSVPEYRDILALNLLVLYTANICKQFGPRSGMTKSPS